MRPHIFIFYFLRFTSLHQVPKEAFCGNWLKLTKCIFIMLCNLYLIKIIFSFGSNNQASRPGGYTHNPTGDTGSAYVHDTTGDHGPYYYWKLRQQVSINSI